MRFNLLKTNHLILSAALLFLMFSPGATAQSNRARLILDMVHQNPGGTPYESKFEDPQVIRQMGYNGKVYFLFDSPMLAVNWDSVDPNIFPKGSPGRAWVDAKAAKIDKEEAGCKATGLKVYAMSDLVLFPKSLIAKYKIAGTFGDPRQPETQKF